jgi:putative transposase
MAKPYSMDLRERAMARLEAGETSYEVAATLKVAVSSVIKWAARKRRLGSAAPGKMGGHRPYLLSGDYRVFVLSEVERDPNVTLHQLTAALAARGLNVHPASVGRFLHREGTKPFCRPSSSGRSWRADARSGPAIRPAVIQHAWSSSTRPGSRPTWRRCVAGARAASGLSPTRHMDTGRR